MANLSYPEFAEITNAPLPVATAESFAVLRGNACESAQRSFKLQSQQKFLRRVLSPDYPSRNLFMIHGTGTGKTCTAIQIAEEYILRPEYQDKKVLVLASAAVQENFRDQIFDMTRVSVKSDALLESKQCTGSRYLEALLRIESTPKNWNNPETRTKLQRIADRLINEFYELDSYLAFANNVMKRAESPGFDEWVHETFDNRLLIVDEAHTIRSGDDMSKQIAKALEILVQKADNLILVLLTATPLFDTFEEIVFYFNLFLWNDRKQDPKTSLKVSDLFKEDGDVKNKAKFSELCQLYVSYVRGENPFTFPFRLPPPDPLVRDAVVTDFRGKPLAAEDRIKYLHKFLVSSMATGLQESVLKREEENPKQGMLVAPTLAVFPKNAEFGQTFVSGSAVGTYRYANEPFLTPETIGNHAAKFVRVLKAIEGGEGIVFVYSNYVEVGARLFAMALEEHGYASASGTNLLENKAYKGKEKGKYLLLSGKITRRELDLISLAKSDSNRDGNKIRVIVSSPIAAEGVDFRNVRQIHVLDPWWNMSRIEQVIGRGLRTCSHTRLTEDKQNCTVYLHVVRTSDGRECYDEFAYRTFAEPKAVSIARVRKLIAESAMDCPLQNRMNTLPDDWKKLQITQKRSEGGADVTYELGHMLAPSFDDSSEMKECIRVIPDAVDPTHVRPLSTYLDISDELMDIVTEKMKDKPIWKRAELLRVLAPYREDVIIYNLQHAIATGRPFLDPIGREARLESKDDIYMLRPLTLSNGTVSERIAPPPVKGRKLLSAEEKPDREAVAEVKEDLLVTKRDSMSFTEAMKIRFKEDILDSYTFDHGLTTEERRAYLRSYPDKVKFADRLRVPGTDYIVLGYGELDPPREPIGEERDKYNLWRDGVLERFIGNRSVLFGSVKASDRKFAIGKAKVDGDKVVRIVEKNAKVYTPIVCGTGDMKRDVVIALSKYVDKEGRGIDKVNATELCIYTELLMREESNCVWVTPEELSILFDDPDSRKRIKDKFKN